MYIIRLDDASEYCNQKKWNRIENILDKYGICPIVGVIPNNKDKTMIDIYEKNNGFWQQVREWKRKNWIIAMHGYQHLYVTDEGGINPVNKRSEFAGLDLDIQKEKISNAYKIFKKHNIEPQIFFAPSHTFDNNTLISLRDETPIRVVSDTIAYDTYCEKNFVFIPQQSGSVRKLPFKIVTFCYHPNMMSDQDFDLLEKFIQENRNKFIQDVSVLFRTKRKQNFFDKLLKYIYFKRRK